MTFCDLALAVVAVDNALASQALMPLLDMEPSETTMVVMLIQAVLAHCVDTHRRNADASVFLAMWIRCRDVLETELGDVSVFKH